MKKPKNEAIKDFTKIFSLIVFLFGITTHAYRPVLRSFHGVRAAGMGDVRYTTGFYEENFFANPARTAENPNNLFQLEKISFEANGAALSNLNTMTRSGSGISDFADAVGKLISGRIQMLFPAYYKKNIFSDKWSFGIGLLFSAQAVGQISKTGLIDPTTIINFGPAISLARRLLDGDRLLIGTTLHTEFRGSSGQPFSMIDYFSGTDIGPSIRGGSELVFNLDLGVTFKPQWKMFDFQYELGGAINQVVGEKGIQIGSKIRGWDADPIRTPRTFSLGLAARRTTLPVFDSYLFSIESTDIGNTANGNIYKTLHLGTEEKWKCFALRGGINQGYFTGGLGINLSFFQINFATYGEELGLDPGTIEDRRYAVDIGFQI